MMDSLPRESKRASIRRCLMAPLRTDGPWAAQGCQKASVQLGHSLPPSLVPSAEIAVLGGKVASLAVINLQTPPHPSLLHCLSRTTRTALGSGHGLQLAPEVWVNHCWSICSAPVLGSWE